MIFTLKTDEHKLIYLVVTKVGDFFFLMYVWSLVTCAMTAVFYFPKLLAKRKYGPGRSQTPCSEARVWSKPANLSECLFLKLSERVWDTAVFSSWCEAAHFSRREKANMNCQTLHRGICITWKLKHSSWPLRGRWERKPKCHIHHWNGDCWECRSRNLFSSFSGLLG